MTREGNVPWTPAAAARARAVPLYAIEGPERWRLLQGVLLGGVATALLLSLVFNERIIDRVVLLAASYTVVGGLVIRARDYSGYSITGAAAAIAGIGVQAAYLASDLSHPESWGSFIPAALVVMGVIASTIAAASGLLASPSSRAPAMVFAVLVTCCAILAVSIVATMLTGSDALRAGERYVLASGWQFTKTLAFPASTTELAITNDDMVRHTFVIEGTDIALELPATKTRHVELDLAPGEYRYFCDVPGHEGMEGLLTVQ